jgi:hypothetical protein
VLLEGWGGRVWVGAGNSKPKGCAVEPRRHTSPTAAPRAGARAHAHRPIPPPREHSVCAGARGARAARCGPPTCSAVSAPSLPLPMAMHRYLTYVPEGSVW